MAQVCRNKLLAHERAWVSRDVEALPQKQRRYCRPIYISYRNLRDSFDDDEAILIGLVKYIDYDRQWINAKDAENFLTSFLYKRKSFEHEREIRALVLKGPQNLDFSQEPIGHGLKIKVDLKRLIEKIYVAPSAPEWFAELVRALIHRYGYAFEVVHSKLDAQPLF